MNGFNRALLVLLILLLIVLLIVAAVVPFTVLERLIYTLQHRAEADVTIPLPRGSNRKCWIAKTGQLSW